MKAALALAAALLACVPLASADDGLALPALPAAAPDLAATPADSPTMCPPPPGSDEVRILYCGLTHGIPTAVDRYLENVTSGPGGPRDLLNETNGLVQEVRGCLAGRYPPCPKMVLAH